MNAKLLIGVMATTTLMLALGVLSANQSAQAANDKFTQTCDGPGQSSKDGECSGNSQDSGPHDETTSNPAGNVPPGQQEPERDDN